MMDSLRLSALVICLLVRSSCGSEQEPRCYSRFDYEEKLLQKTIHTDFQMKEYVRQMDKAMEEIREFNDLKASIEKIAEDLKTSVTTTTTELVQEIAEMRETLVRQRIVFNARQAADNSPDNYAVIVFQTILQNIGGAYDSNTGIFTAPFNGTFMFHVKACKNYQQWERFQLVVDSRDSVILTMSDYNNNADATTSSASVAVYLAAGQKIWVQSRYNSGSSETLEERESYCWNQFSGSLVHT